MKHALKAKVISGFLVFSVLEIQTVRAEDLDVSILDTLIPTESFQERYHNGNQLQKTDFEVFPYDLQEYLGVIDWARDINSGFSRQVGPNEILLVVNDNRGWSTAARGAVVTYSSNSAILPRKDLAWKPLVLPYVRGDESGFEIFTTDTHLGMFAWDNQVETLQLWDCGEENISYHRCWTRFTFKVSASTSVLLKAERNDGGKFLEKDQWRTIYESGG